MVGSNTSKIAFFGERRGQCFLSPVLVSVSGGALALCAPLTSARPGAPQRVLRVPPWDLLWCCQALKGGKSL